MSVNTTPWPTIGTIWQENDPRVNERRVKVVVYDLEKGKVGICWCSRDGSRVSARMTWAKPERFNGKRSGYKRVVE